jgi:hypothetical protein
MSSDNLKPAIEIKCWGLVLKCVWVLHNIGFPHTHTGTWAVETPLHVHFEVLELPPCSPDVSPSITCLVLSQALQKAISLLVTSKWRNLCLRVLPLSQKHFFIRSCRNLFPAGQSIVNSTGLNGKWFCYVYCIDFKKYFSDTFWPTHMQGLARK